MENGPPVIHVLGSCKRDTTPTFSFFPLLLRPLSCKDSSYSSTFSFNPPVKILSVFANVSPHQHSSSVTSILHHSGFCSGPCVPQPRRLSSPHEVFPTPPTAHTRYPPIKSDQIQLFSLPLQSVSCLSWVLQPLATPQTGQLA